MNSWKNVNAPAGTHYHAPPYSPPGDFDCPLCKYGSVFVREDRGRNYVTYYGKCIDCGHRYHEKTLIQWGWKRP
jgi:DNA-directed RNA polymerase subunit M/transcription elongation factor TFIIS